MKISLHAVTCRHPSAPSGTAAALRAVNLTVDAGEQLAIIGPSGAGKTTLLHLLACAQKPTAGTLLLNDQDPWQLSRSALQTMRRALFLAPQVPPLPPRQRVVTAVLAGRLPHESLWASLRSWLYPQDIGRASRALAGFDVDTKLFERVDRLSGGERQRVGLARVLVSEACLLLVDEPLSALDSTRALHTITTLTHTARARGATLIATLHHVDMALTHFERIVGLRDGAVAFDLPAAQVSPQHLQALYAQHLDDLTAPHQTTLQDLPTAPAPVAMHCR